MLPQVIEKAKVKPFVDRLIKNHKVLGPVAKGPNFVFEQIESLDSLRLDYPITLLSPTKKYLFPPYECLLKFKLDPQLQVEPIIESEPLVFLGVHPCDIYATWLFDTVFSTKNPDPNYLERRKKATVIGLDCLKPCDEYQFCLDMGSLYADEGYDLFLTDMGDAYFVDIATDKGQQLLVETQQSRPATNQDFARRRDAGEQKRQSFRNKLSVESKYLPEVLQDSYDSLIWEATARRCYSCGSCNTVCPTCYCFDVNEIVDLTLRQGVRRRMWDSCQLDSFATVAGGHNFRKERSARLRHRFFRKGKLIREAFGKSGCVGCGRCDRACTAKISSVEVYNMISGSR